MPPGGRVIRGPHPDSRITCIDTFEGSWEHANLDLSELEQRFDHNVSRHAEKVTKLKGPSRQWLRTLEPASYDFVFIDGSHDAPDVLYDGALGWDLTKPGGILMFDDYEGGNPGVPMAVDALMECMRGKWDLLARKYVLALRKLG